MGEGDATSLLNSDILKMRKILQVEDRNPAYESANMESTQVTDMNPQYLEYENAQLNSIDQLDDYDYMGNHDD